MDSGYTKISRKSRGGQRGGCLQSIWSLMLVGFMVGIILSAVIGGGLLVSGLLPGIDGGPAATVIATQLVEVEQIVTSDAQVAAVVTATTGATATPVQPTPTPTSTATALPTATSIPPTAPPSATPDFTISGAVENEVSIRYGPGTNYPRLALAQADERFQITSWHSQLPWIQIRYDGSPTGYGWVFDQLLVDLRGDYRTLTPITTAVLNLPTLTPTPSVIQSGASFVDVELSPEFVALGDELFNIMLDAGFDPETRYFGSLYLLDLQTGEALSFGENIAYSGTSVNKISILLGLYRSLTAPPNQTLANNIANTMICSENSNTNQLISVIGGGNEWQGAERITETLRMIGIDDSYLLAPYTVDPANPPVPPAPLAVPETSVNQERAFPEPYNQLTVEDAGRMLSSIYQCAYQESGPLIENFPANTYEPRECRQMIHVMANNDVDGLLRAGAPAQTRVAHKHGWIDATHSNAGIFFTPGGDYVLAMSIHSNVEDATGNRYLSFQNAPISSLPAFAEVSRTVYNYYNPQAPLTSIREGFIPDAPSCNYAGTRLVDDLMQPVWNQ